MEKLISNHAKRIINTKSFFIYWLYHQILLIMINLGLHTSKYYTLSYGIRPDFVCYICTFCTLCLALGGVFMTIIVCTCKWFIQFYMVILRHHAPVYATKHVSTLLAGWFSSLVYCFSYWYNVLIWATANKKLAKHGSSHHATGLEFIRAWRANMKKTLCHLTGTCEPRHVSNTAAMATIGTDAMVCNGVQRIYKDAIQYTWRYTRKLSLSLYSTYGCVCISNRLVETRAS